MLDLYARTRGDEVSVVIEAEPFVLAESASFIEVRFAPVGKARELLTRALAASRAPSDTYVATSDEMVLRSARHRGVQTIPPRVFRGWLESFEW